jgi:hypothetical protein
MFSKEESKKLRQEFWISFGKSFPRKWILYNTKIKDFSFKFYFDTKKAIVALDIETDNFAERIKYYEKIQSLKTILKEEYLPDVVFEDCYLLENGKELSRIFVQLDGVSIHNKNTWQQTMEFFNKNMNSFEAFYLEYIDFIKS